MANDDDHARYRNLHHEVSSMPYYNLADVKTLVLEGRYYVTLQASQDAFNLGFDDEGVWQCVLTLSDSHFYKSMPAEKVPGLWQDVYRLRYEDVRVYLKLQIDFTDRAIVISFKEDTGWI